MREHTARLDIHSGLSRSLQEVDAGASPDDPPSLASEPEPVEAPVNIPAQPIQLEHFLAKRLPRTGPRTRMFRRAHFPDVKDSDWHDWRWQLRHSFRTTEQLARVLELTDEERTALDRCGSLLPVAVTPYYMSLLGAFEITLPSGLLTKLNMASNQGGYLGTLVMGLTFWPLPVWGNRPRPSWSTGLRRAARHSGAGIGI